MIYNGRSVAYLKLIIGNARVVLWLVQDTLSLTLSIAGKLGWLATSSFLWFCWYDRGLAAKPASDRRKSKRDDSIPSSPFFLCFVFPSGTNHSNGCDILIPAMKFLATERGGGTGSDISNSIVFECSASPGITNHTLYYGSVDVLNYFNNLMVPPLPCPQNCFTVVRKLCFSHQLECWVIRSLKLTLLHWSGGLLGLHCV